jgi:hypothetical protein
MCGSKRYRRIGRRSRKGVLTWVSTPFNCVVESGATRAARGTSPLAEMESRPNSWVAARNCRDARKVLARESAERQCNETAPPPKLRGALAPGSRIYPPGPTVPTASLGMDVGLGDLCRVPTQTAIRNISMYSHSKGDAGGAQYAEQNFAIAEVRAGADRL